MEVGNKLVLVDEPFSSHNRPLEFKQVEITQKRVDVPGMFGSGIHEGYIAVDDGGNEYKLHWSSFPDDSTTPNWMWFGKDKAWYDNTYNYMEEYPAELARRLAKKYPDAIAYCEKHNKLHHVFEKCFRCEYPSRAQPKEKKPKQKIKMS